MKYRLVLFATNLQVASMSRLYLKPKKRKASYIIYFKERAELLRFAQNEIFDCALYRYRDGYFIVTDARRAAMKAMEYGAAANISQSTLAEHGTKLSDKNGLSIVREYF